MARRRRLEPPASAELAAIHATAAQESVGRHDRNLLGLAPIAQVASDSVNAQKEEIEALRRQADDGRRAAERLEHHEAQGLLLLNVPIDEVDVDYLCRDRLPAPLDDESWVALKTSIQTHGQRTPIEVTHRRDNPRPYGLISGYRRFAVIQHLFETTGDPRWRTVRVARRDAGTLGQAFINMVEENEVREDLSHFERGRVCVRAVEQGAFPTVDSALDALFATASPAKRSKIRSFILIAEELGDLLIHPREIGERLGLRLSHAIKSGQSGAIRRMIGDHAAHPLDAAREQAMLGDVLKRLSRRSQAPSTTPLEERSIELPSGMQIALRRTRRSLQLRITGEPVSSADMDRALDALSAVFSSPGSK